MNIKEIDDYYLGLDIGTQSVGYAVTNKEYKIVKFNGKAMWGSRLFDQADTAKERRVFRSNARRLKRRKSRIQLLQELFKDEICKKDISFFQRLKENNLFREDRNIKDKYSLFNDEKYTDIDFHGDFKTIYHLRRDLILNEKEYDVRCVYLAIHHILKNRGHFLFTGTIENVTSFETSYQTFVNILDEKLGIEIICNDKKELEKLLKDRKLSKKEKNNKIIKLLNCNKENKQLKAIIGLIIGSSVKVKDVFDDDELKDIEKPNISLAEDSYEDLRNKLEIVLQDRCIILDGIKVLYDWSILANILKENVFLSFAKVDIFEQHEKDLRILKELFKKYDINIYREFFKKNHKDNYCSYVGFLEKNNKKIRIKKCKKEDFYNSIKKIIKKIESDNGENKITTGIKERITQEVFMPLQVEKSNGVIPYQVNYMELKKILENSKKHLKFLEEKDSNGISVEEKILTLLEFRIPYYIGPINTYHKTNSWMIRNEEGKITPWNFSEKVNIDESAKVFIRRMTGKCTYLLGEDVLPKNSILYNRFEVLNELNNIKIKGYPIEVDLKKEIYNKLFKNHIKVTKKMLLGFLISEGYKLESEDITGIDKAFNSSLKSYIEMKRIFNRDIVNGEDIKVIEDIILYVTLYKADLNMLERVIRRSFTIDQINKVQLKRILGCKYDGWGALSRELLISLEGISKETGEVFTIIKALENTDKNLIQLLSIQYTFIEKIEKYNREKMGDINDITYDNLVKELYVSPKTKRAIWQVIQITEEVKKIAGKEPKKIFIEVAREHQKSIKSKSRKDQLIELYKKCKDEEREWKVELENRAESDFRSIKLYLYYTQMGRCMYTGDRIELSELANTTVYDRDHIYPQSLTKDNSIDNLVLVKKKVNAEKDNGLISSDIQKKMKVLWKELKIKGFITEEKYSRLTRRTPLSNEELAGFINRQLVEVRQSTKIIANLFKQLYKKSEIVYVKANLVSDFRKDVIKEVKVRTLNDLHHAKDAYLNIVVGNVYHEKFTNNPLEWIKKNKDKNSYSLNKVFKFDLIKKEEYIWRRGKEGTEKIIKNQMRKNDMQYTRQTISNKGKFFDLQIVSAKDNPKIPIKKGIDVKKYGGYKGIIPAYFALVESINIKGEKIRTIEAVPLYKINEFESNINIFEKYCVEKHGLISPKILIPKIKKNTVFVVNKFPMNLRGISGENQLSLQCAVQLNLLERDEIYFKKIEKYIKRNEDRIDKKELLKINEYDGISLDRNLELYEILLIKQRDTIYKNRPGSQVEKLEKGKERFKFLKLEEQCIVLNEILNLMRCKPATANLSLIGGAKEAGRIVINKNITNNKSIKIRNKSVTGLFSAPEIDLLKI